jgi:hypothetical protein
MPHKGLVSWLSSRGVKSERPTASGLITPLEQGWQSKYLDRCDDLEEYDTQDEDRTESWQAGLRSRW